MRHDSCVRARAGGVLAALVLSLASRAVAQPLPVVLEMNGGGDDRWESIQLAIGGLHVDNQLPLAIAVVPCTQASPPGNGCDDDGSLHSTFQLWTSQHPTIIEVGQQGRDNTEMLGNLGPVQQRALIEEGLAALLGWGLGNDEPMFFTPPRSSATSETIAIVEDLGFRSFGQVAGTCATGGNDIDKLCNSVSLCQRNATGGRVSGPACVLRSFDDLATEIEARAAEGVLLVSYSPQDLSVSTSDISIDPAKRTAYEALLAAFADAEAEGRFELRTFDTHYRLTRGLPLPTPESTPRPTPTPITPTNLPVVFSEDDPEDGTWEAATLRVHEAFISELVPRVQQTVACGAPSPTDGSACINTDFHLIYADWVRANPGLVEIGHHGLTHDEVLTNLNRDQQLDFISRGLAEMETWGLPDRPYTFAAPFSAEQGQRDRAEGQRFEIEEQAEQRRRDHQRQASGDPVRNGLGERGEFQRRAAHQNEIERAVLVVGREQAIEREQRGEQGAEPKDRRADAAQLDEIRPDRERDQGHDDEEEQDAHQRAAADPDGEPHVADKEGGEGGHVRALPAATPSCLNPQRPMRRRHNHPAVPRCSRMSSASRSCPAASSAEVGSSNSQIGRGTAIRRASESRRRWPAER